MWKDSLFKNFYISRQNLNLCLYCLTLKWTLQRHLDVVALIVALQLNRRNIASESFTTATSPLVIRFFPVAFSTLRSVCAIKWPHQILFAFRMFTSACWFPIFPCNFFQLRIKWFNGKNDLMLFILSWLWISYYLDPTWQEKFQVFYPV